MIVLGIETTCDETAIAIVRDGQEILANEIASQIDLHSRFGGVFPELACRQHIDVILPLIDQALAKASMTKDEIDLIAVAHCPGLLGALLIGLTTAKALSIAWNKPFIGVNHVHAHLIASMMDTAPQFPALGIVLSGGHTHMLDMQSIHTFSKIGATVDDAIGEAFDKTATLLGLPYPGGPEIEKLALNGNPNAYPLKAGQVKNSPLDFSFSGLKTNVLYTLKGPNGKRSDPDQLTDAQKADLAASFQHAAFSDIVKKALATGHTRVYLGGGVTANTYLKKLFNEIHLETHFPAPGLSLDNGAMIAALGHHLYLKHGPSPLDLEASPRAPLT